MTTTPCLYREVSNRPVADDPPPAPPSQYACALGTSFSGLMSGCNDVSKSDDYSMLSACL